MEDQRIKDYEEKIASLESLNKDIKHSFDELVDVLVQLSESISLKHDSEALMDIIAKLVDNILNYKSLTILLRSPNGDYKPAINRRITPMDEKKVRLILEDELITWAVDKRKSIIMPDIFDEDGVGESCYVISPLISQEKPLGCILIFVDKSPEHFSGNDLELLNILSAQSATGLQNALLYGLMEENNRNLAQLKNYLADVIENMKNGLLVIDLTGKITTFNNLSSKYLNRSLQEVYHRDYHDVFSPEFIHIIEEFQSIYEAGGAPGSQEITLTNSTGDLPLRVTGTWLRDDDNAINGIIVMLQDLTESKEIDRLRELDKLKSELIANVSHELRTPLTSVKAYAETLLDMVEEHDTETEKEFLGIICDESERLTNLISNLLNLSRMESGNIKLEIEEFDIKELTLKCVTLLNELALQRNVKIETDLPMGPLMLRADQGKIEQVIINLISNAVKYNKEDGIVTLALTIINDEAVLVVRDTGLGIPVDSLSRIFEKFYRVDTSLTYEISGTGLGLAIVKHIVESHHGKIIVDSLEGEWTEFTLMLPLEGVESEF